MMKLWSSTLAATILVFTGCKSTGADQAAKTAGIMQRLAVEFDKAPAEVDAITGSLAQLVDGGGTRPDYDAFKKNVAAIESRAERIRGMRKTLETNRNEFTKAWEERLARIQSEDLRARAEERRERVVATFEDLGQKADAVGAVYQPWVQTLRDINQYVEFNLNQEGVASIADMVEKVNGGAESLKQELDTLNSEIRRVAEAIEAATPPEPEKSGSTGSNN